MNVVDFLVGDPSRVATGWTLAVVSEGYTERDLNRGLFAKDVSLFVAKLLATPPFNHPDILPLINVIKVSEKSQNSGNEIELRNPPPEESPFHTAFGAMFGRKKTPEGVQIRRLLYGDNRKVQEFVRRQPGLAAVNYFLVIVNNTKIYGASGGSVAWTSKNPATTWTDTAVHEIGHHAFNLDDEYPYSGESDNDPIRTFPADTSDSTAPNVAKAGDLAKLKWASLVTLHPSFVPTTVQTSPCVRNHPVKPSIQPIGEEEIGAYEGAAHFDCGLYRPALNCKMREDRKHFCRVCEAVGRINIGHYMVTPSDESAMAAGAWTHVQSFLEDNSRMLSYNSDTGAYAISHTHGYFGSERRPDGTPPLSRTNPDLGTGSIGQGWTWLVPFTLNGTLHHLVHQFDSGRLGMFKTNEFANTLIPTFASPSGNVFHTHVVTLTIDGAAHFIGYNRFTGDASLFRIDSDSSDPTPVTTMQWGRGHTSVVSVPIDGEPFVLTYRIATGEVMIRRITPPGFTMTFASKLNFWVTNLTHLSLLELGGRSYIIRHCAFNGRTSLHHLRASGSGADFVCGIPPSGSGAPTRFGVGAPAVGKMSFPPPTGSVTFDAVFLYNAIQQNIHATPLSVR